MKSSSVVLALPLALFAGLAVGCSGSNVSAPATTASPNAQPPILGLVESIDLDKNVMPRPLERPAELSTEMKLSRYWVIGTLSGVIDGIIPI